MWPEADKTAELLAKAQGGDDGAVSNLLDRHRDALRRLVDMRMDPALKRRVDASDIVQDVLIEANRRLRDYMSNPVMPFHLWLRHMAKDRIIDAHRRHRVAKRRSLDREQPLVSPGGMDHSTMELAQELWDGELTPQAAATRQEAILRFQAALEELDEADQEIVLMRNFEQLSNQEVAQALGLSEAAASMRYLRAIRKLRPKLGGEMEESESP